eukprot:GHVT01097997.1.p1 GENE.GHVT01097997.1~~GHVT01097997.1.p1  ORF type:complete len:351 (-),score=39.72 GHVT01097997.1:175-1227(-)
MDLQQTPHQSAAGKGRTCETNISRTDPEFGGNSREAFGDSPALADGGNGEAGDTSSESGSESPVTSGPSVPPANTPLSIEALAEVEMLAGGAHAPRWTKAEERKRKQRRSELLQKLVYREGETVKATGAVPCTPQHGVLGGSWRGKPGRRRSSKISFNIGLPVAEEAADAAATISSAAVAASLPACTEGQIEEPAPIKRTVEVEEPRREAETKLLPAYTDEQIKLLAPIAETVQTGVPRGEAEAIQQFGVTEEWILEGRSVMRTLTGGFRAEAGVEVRKAVLVRQGGCWFKTLPNPPRRPVRLTKMNAEEYEEWMVDVRRSYPHRRFLDYVAWGRNEIWGYLTFFVAQPV